jgi:hypothetical protein
MASIVLSGTGPVTYTNSTGQNVRFVINYMAVTFSGTVNVGYNMSWGEVNILVYLYAIGRNLAVFPSGQNAFGAVPISGNFYAAGSAPTEIMLSPGQTFSTSNNSRGSGQSLLTSTLGAYNIVVIPEAG